MAIPLYLESGIYYSLFFCYSNIPCFLETITMAETKFCIRLSVSLSHLLSTRPEINVNFGKQSRMRCKAASAPQCEHCKHEPTQQRAGSGSQKHIYLRVST